MNASELEMSNETLNEETSMCKECCNFVKLSDMPNGIICNNCESKCQSNEKTSSFERFRRKQIAELRTVTNRDILEYQERGFIKSHETKDSVIEVSISDVDRQNGSPKIGDMIARNPKNYLDQWLVAGEYFKDNFEAVAPF